MCFVHLEYHFDGISRKVIEWVMWKKRISSFVVGAVMSAYDGGKVELRVVSECLLEFDAKVSAPRICVLAFPMYLFFMVSLI